jgi:hypothetical protein
MEYWNDGMLEDWNDEDRNTGIVECEKIGRVEVGMMSFKPIIPLFHRSNGVILC